MFGEETVKKREEADDDALLGGARLNCESSNGEKRIKIGDLGQSERRTFFFFFFVKP